MAFISAPQCPRSSVIYDLGGQTIVNTLWFKWAAPATAGDCASLNTALHTWWTAHLKTVLSPTLGLKEIVTVAQDSPSAPNADLIVNPYEYGTHGTASLPNGVAIVITERTALRGRNYRGRIYIPGMDIGDRNDSISLQIAKLGDIITQVQWLLTAANTAGAVWSVVSHFLNKAARGTAINTPITAVSGDNYFDSQRRRLALRGA